MHRCRVVIRQVNITQQRVALLDDARFLSLEVVFFEAREVFVLIHLHWKAVCSVGKLEASRFSISGADVPKVKWCRDFFHVDGLSVLVVIVMYR